MARRVSLSKLIMKRVLIAPLLLSLCMVAKSLSSESHEFRRAAILSHTTRVNSPVIACDSRRCSMNIAIVMDASGSIVPQDYSKAKEFAKAFISNLYDDTHQRIRFGFLVFSQIVTISFDLTNTFALKELENLVDSANHDMRSTRTDIGIRAAREMLLNYNYPNYSTAQNVILILTDGKSDDQSATEVEAKLAAAANITIVAVGIGGAIDKKDLQVMTSEEKYVVLVPSFNELGSFICPIEQLACRTPPNNEGEQVNGPSAVESPALPLPVPALVWKPVINKKVTFVPLHRIISSMINQFIQKLLWYITILTV